MNYRYSTKNSSRRTKSLGTLATNVHLCIVDQHKVKKINYLIFKKNVI